MNIFEPNWEHIREEADKVRESDQGFRDIERYEWKDGENTHRMCPPYNARGMFFFKKGTHFKVRPDNDTRDCLLSWPDVFDNCPLCDAIDKILKLIPNIDLSRCETAWAYYANIIDRDEEDKGPQICRYTSGVRNWYMLQFDNRKVGDLSDIEHGFDVTIIKKEKKGKKGSFVEYKCDRDPDRSPLSENDENVVKWLSELFDLDKVMGPPNDDRVAEIRNVAKAMERYYLKKYRDDTDDDDRYSRRRRDNDDNDRQERSSRQDKDDDDRKETRSRKRDDVEDRDVKSPDDGDKYGRQARKDKANDIGDVNPTDVPKCHAGLDEPEPHSDGSIGFNANLEKCLISCDEEYSCMNAKKQKNI